MKVCAVHRGSRLLHGLVLFTLVLAPLGCDDDDEDVTAPPPAAVSVSMVDNEFAQVVDTVAVGGTVTWTNNGANPHTSTSDTGVWDSAQVDPGGSFEFAFDEPGTFEYHCTFHGAAGGAGMSGTIVVR